MWIPLIHFAAFHIQTRSANVHDFFSPTKSFTRVNSIHSDFWKIVFRCLSKYDMWYGVFVMEKVTISFSLRSDNVGSDAIFILIICNGHLCNMSTVRCCKKLFPIIVCQCFAAFTMLHVIHKFWILQLKLLIEKQIPKLYSKLIPSYSVDIAFPTFHCIPYK